MKRALIVLAAGVALLSTGVLSSAQRVDAGQTIDPADFSPVITNSLFPLSNLGPKVLVGEDTDPDTDETIDERLESRVLPQTESVAGVTVLVLEEKAYEDGELVEVALDYFAQHTNGDVYYFGERVDNYEDGMVANHDGQWLAGVDGAEPGVIMAAQPQVGTTYQQELAPGIAEDKATVLSLSETVVTPAGTYTNCLKTRDFTPLEPDVEEFKFHCPGVGLVREDFEGGFIELVSIGPSPVGATPTTAAPTPATSATPQPAVVAPDAGDGPDVNGPSYAWTATAIIAGFATLIGGAALLRGRTRKRT